MSTLATSVGMKMKWRYAKLAFQSAVSVLVIVLSLLLFIYPAVTIGIPLADVHATDDAGR